MGRPGYYGVGSVLNTPERKRHTMSGTLVVHNSITGFSQTYATWIAEELGAVLAPWSQARRRPWGRFDLVVYCAGVRMSAVRGFPAVRRKAEKEGLAGRGRLLVLATGGTPVHLERDWRVPAATLTRAELAQGRYPLFYVEGGVRYEGLNPVEKTLLRIFSHRVQRYRHRGEWAVAVADSIADGYDHTDRRALEPLLAAARERLAVAGDGVESAKDA